MMISAVMVTGKSPARLALAKAAVQCFLEQTYPYKELIIINDGPTEVGTSCEKVREIRVRSGELSTLGELRNFGARHACGEFVMQWDDDDWHHPLRMELQMAHWQPGAAVLLKNQIRYNFLDGNAFVFHSQMGIHGTILYKQEPSILYPKWRKREDTLFLTHFPQRICVECYPPAYIRFVHGSNTWSCSHIMGKCASTLPPLKKHEMELLEFVLQNYYRLGVDQPCERDAMNPVAMQPARLALNISESRAHKFPGGGFLTEVLPMRALGIWLLFQEFCRNRISTVGPSLISFGESHTKEISKHIISHLK